MIKKFEGKYRFLSNFYPSRIEFVHVNERGDITGVWAPTVEHAYQSLKTENLNECLKVLSAHTPGEAKNLGRKVTMRPDWDNIKLPVMENLLKRKFSDNVLKEQLLNTKDEELIEGNYWNDTYWGVCRGVGQNNLGKLLMKVRNEIRKS